MRKVSHKQPKRNNTAGKQPDIPAYMLSEGATSALDASKAGRCFGWDVRIRFGRNRQRDGRGGRSKETGEANLTANMLPKGTTVIKCRGKGGDEIAD